VLALFFFLTDSSMGLQNLMHHPKVPYSLSFKNKMKKCHPPRQKPLLRVVLIALEFKGTV